MTKEEDPTEIQSSVQYKRFDNSDVEDENKPSDGTPTPETSPSPPERREKPRDDPENGASELVDNKPPNERDASEGTGRGKDGEQGKEIILQMNGTLGSGEPPQEPAWNWLNLVISIASIFCCSVCGVLATVTSVLAYVDHRVGDFNAAHRKRVASYGLALSALIVGVICMVIIVLVAIHFDNKSI
ncbi:hypothetical protein LSH36_232g02017 [Paralvinella palmiformis]|uniref:Uncharacterized protein n=1 Tax=Paralvinella palmiformis TaxID=53620 RepID=A0AAD9N536_9ANNE|nr:hypothetical protein LSH36_232g02017 [Paralvinella palmiformis]